ncbi:voltage-dependent calcium channel subunit alpha-2/delta-2-like isoform X2 [Lineus longissimus]|uniref:voltage-dependent calcium channel subunit alpha-2/delta-2-like isoform X2 n=1 Tax=Lineus longissimus TaxID=88925 RepID=UPI00315C8E97
MALTATLCFAFCGIFFGIISNLMAFPSNPVELFGFKKQVRRWADTLDFSLADYVRMNSGIDKLVQEYNKFESYARFTRVDREGIAKQVASDLQKLLHRKMQFLEKNVAAAERFAAAHKTNDSLKITDVEYVAAKKVSANDTRFTFSPQFKQKVAENFSSVHIPVEIYEGDSKILNGLKWSAHLDEIWMANRKEDPSLLWQYFGSQAGFMRTLPASKWRGEGVDLYDVRRRTWYTQGSSSPKDMLILIDTSGSVHGQALQLMKVAVKSLLDTLGENDFVNVAYFNKEVHFISCFDTFVQANHRNKQLLNVRIDSLAAGEMASYNKALEFAFKQFKKFRQTAVKGQGAQCNEVIMLLTDGGTEMPEDVFKKYNWPKMDTAQNHKSNDAKVRVFTYAVGPTATPLAAVKWMACSNRGYFSRIPAMGAIRTKVQEYVPVLGRPMALNSSNTIKWTNIKLAANSHHSSKKGNSGLGMMTTVTLPVYDRGSNSSNNQTILGVMGIDVTTKEMEAHVPIEKLGPNGYGFSINANGYIVFHPDLKAQKGWLKDPPNVDFLEIEVGNEEKEELRNDMIQAKAGEQLLETFVIAKDELYIRKKQRYYTHQPIPNTTFSIGIVTPKGYEKYITIRKSIPDGTEYLVSNDAGILIAPWDYCVNISKSLFEANGVDAVDILINATNDTPKKCDSPILRHLYWDAMATKGMEPVWKDNDKFEKEIDSFFAATSGGLLRVYPINATGEYDVYRDPHKSAYFHRILDDPELTLFIPPYSTSVPSDPNATAPAIMAVRAATLFREKFKGAAAGIKIRSETIKRMLLSDTVGYCNDQDKTVCYLIDNGGFMVATNQDDKEMKIGQFLGQVDPTLMTFLYNESVFDRVIHYDYQASCPKKDDLPSAGPRSIFIPSIPFFELLSINWWTSKVAWAYASFNVYNWLFGDLMYTGVYAADMDEEVADNVSCITRGAHYYFTDLGNNIYQSTIECDNCTRQYYAARLLNTNLMLVITEPECFECQHIPPIQAPKEDGGPDICKVRPRYRKRPGDCHSWDAAENTTDCGACSNVRGSFIIVFFVSLLALISLRET